MDASKKVAIVGGGPAGLTLAAMLCKAGINATVYEREASPSVRSQGGTLDMQADTGQVALERIGLLQRFLAESRHDGQDVKMLSHDGRVLLDEKTPPDQHFHPEIDRGDLRHLLLSVVPPSAIQWGRVLREVRPLPGHRWQLVFADGATADADLVVGADGAWSRIRPLVSPAKPVYSGVMFVEIHFRDVDTTHPEVAALIGKGTMFALAHSRGLLAHRLSHGHANVYVAFRAAEDWLAEAGLAADDTAGIRRALQAKFVGWAPSLQQLLVECDDVFVHRPIYGLPVPHTWKPVSGVTLLGDAAHLMSPFSGQGANLAMLDASDLGLALIEEASIDAAVARFEAVMHPRGAEAAAGAGGAIQDALSEDGEQHMIDQFLSHASDHGVPV